MRTLQLASWAPARPAPRRHALGQVPGMAVRIAVVDVDGRLVQGARVIARLSETVYTPAMPAGAGSSAGETGGDGIFVASFAGPRSGSEAVEIVVEKDGYGKVQTATIDEGNRGTIFVQLPVCLPQPFLTGVEWGSLVAGLALTAAGLYWKFQPAELIGEVLVGAAAFTAIYRHSCL